MPDAGLAVRSSDTPAPHVFARASRLPPGVASMVGYRGDRNPPAVHRGVPSPYLTVVISPASPVESSWHEQDLGTPAATRRPVVVAGLHHRPVFIRQGGFEEGVQLAVHPLAARRLFGAPAAELSAVDGDDGWFGRHRHQAHEVLERGTWPERFGQAEALVGRLSATHTGRTSPRPEVVAAWRWLAGTRGNIAMDELARRVGLSGRQLRAELVREVGYGPKALARLFRFASVIGGLAGAVAAGRAVRLADVAAAAGFADQAHLAREFTGYLGVGPTRWLMEERRNIQAGGHRNGPG